MSEPSEQAQALLDAVLTLLGIAAGPAVFASGLLACVELYAHTHPPHGHHVLIGAAVDRGIAIAFPYGLIFGLAAFVYQLANVPS